MQVSRKWETHNKTVFTCCSTGWALLISIRDSVCGGSSSSGTSLAITTTGFTCSSSAEALKKLGGFYLHENK